MQDGEGKDESGEKLQYTLEVAREVTTKVVYVDQLADEHDYWLSLTDAARITRRQEVTVRRWVIAGTLPVRRTPMGVNKRTRHVRASDLAHLTPIIDPTAAITGVPANADLLSIPVQHAQILMAHQALLQQAAFLAQHVTTLQSQLADQQHQHTAALEQIRATTLTALAQTQEQFASKLSSLMQQVHEHSATSTQGLADLTTAFQHETTARIMAQDHHATLLRESSNDLSSLQTRSQQFETLVAQIQHGMDEHVQHRQADSQHQQQVAQHQHETDQRLQALVTTLHALEHQQDLHEQQAAFQHASLLRSQDDLHVWQQRTEEQLAVMAARWRRRVWRGKRR